MVLFRPYLTLAKFLSGIIGFLSISIIVTVRQPFLRCSTMPCRLMSLRIRHPFDDRARVMIATIAAVRVIARTADVIGILATSFAH